MQLSQEILIYLLKREGFDLQRDFDNECYRALAKIREVLRDDTLEDGDDTLEDEDCFMRIERIITIYEELGSGGGTRHDFG